jgi:hypothetical protein
LLRQAPNTWDISPTYDTKRLSVRVGMTFDDSMIYAYQWSMVPIQSESKGPSGDQYLHSHSQLDAQASYEAFEWLSVYVYGLNQR